MRDERQNQGVDEMREETIERRVGLSKSDKIPMRDVYMIKIFFCVFPSFLSACPKFNCIEIFKLLKKIKSS